MANSLKENDVSNTLLSILAQEQSSPFSMAPLFLLMLIFIVFMIFSSRSRKRQEREHLEKVKSLDKGARVMLSSGLIATIEKIDIEAQEVRLLIDEDKRVFAVYSLAAVAKIFEEKKSSVKKDD